MKRTVLLFAFLIFAGTVAPAATAQLRKAERALKDQNFEEAHNSVQERLAKKPGDHRAYELLARIHRAQALASEGDMYLQHWGDMVAAFRKAVELRPKSEGEVTQQLLLEYQRSFMGGVEAFNGATSATEEEARMSLFAHARTQFEAAALVMPDSVDPYVNWAFAAMSGGADTLAIEPLVHAIEIGPVELDWVNYLGRIYLTNDREQEAVPVLEKGVEMFPENEELQGLLLNAYAVTGQNERAIERYQERAEAMPDDRITRYNLGSLLLQAERYDEAIEQLEAAVGIDDQHVDAHYNLGAAFINKATGVQDEASVLDDELRAARDTLAVGEIEERQSAIDALMDMKRDLMQLSIPPLERAKVLAEEQGKEVASICRALFQAYAQVDAVDKVEEVTACAGY